MREYTYKFDTTIFIVVLILLVLGVVMVYSASSFKAQEAHQDSDYFLKNHFYKVLFGFLLMIVAAKVDYHFWLKISPLLIVLSFCALLYLLIAPGVETIRGSKRWIIWGAVQFQPSDFARIALILFMSSTLGRMIFKNHSTDKSIMWNLAIIILMAISILFQPDMGTAALILFIAGMLIFLAGSKLRYLIFPGIIAIPVFITILMQDSNSKQRIMQYIASLKGEQLSWQTQQSLIALGNGGFFGIGLGSGRQKYHFLPDPFTDFIYAIIGEELGVLGTVVILVLFLILLWRGFKLSMQTPDAAGRLLGTGIILNIAVYALTNAGVVVNLLPITGIPMPFISYGGTALIMNLFGIGTLLNISYQNRQKGRIYPVHNNYARPVKSRRYDSARKH